MERIDSNGKVHIALVATKKIEIVGITGLRTILKPITNKKLKCKSTKKISKSQMRKHT